MSCGQIALSKAGIIVDNYFASEIDKHAISITMKNFPNTQQLGNVVEVDGHSLPKIDLLIGGSPCQSFSFAGKRKGMSTKSEEKILTLDQYLYLKQEGFQFEGQSFLFWEYIRLLNELRIKNQNVFFFLENVIMSEEWEKVLSFAIGVNPIEVNSSLVSGQNRRRLYWTNIGMKPSGLFGYLETFIKQPKDKKILLKDILQDNPNAKHFLSEKAIEKIKRHNNNSIENIKSNTIHAGYYKNGGRDQQYVCQDIEEKYFLSEKTIDLFKDNHKKMVLNNNGFSFNPTNGMKKASTITTKEGRRMENNYLIVASRGRNPENPKSRKSGINTQQQLEARFDGKTNCLTSVQKDNLLIHFKDSKEDSSKEKNFRIRRLTPVECERLQTVPDNYTEGVSDTQRYKMLGNGWTVDVVKHFFEYLPF